MQYYFKILDPEDKELAVLVKNYPNKLSVVKGYLLIDKEVNNNELLHSITKLLNRGTLEKGGAVCTQLQEQYCYKELITKTPNLVFAHRIYYSTKPIPRIGYNIYIVKKAIFHNGEDYEYLNYGLLVFNKKTHKGVFLPARENTDFDNITNYNSLVDKAIGHYTPITKPVGDVLSKHLHGKYTTHYWSLISENTNQIKIMVFNSVSEIPNKTEFYTNLLMLVVTLNTKLKEMKKQGLNPATPTLINFIKKVGTIYTYYSTRVGFTHLLNGDTGYLDTSFSKLPIKKIHTINAILNKNNTILAIPVVTLIEYSNTLLALGRFGLLKILTNTKAVDVGEARWNLISKHEAKNIITQYYEKASTHIEDPNEYLVTLIHYRDRNYMLNKINNLKKDEYTTLFQISPELFISIRGVEGVQKDTGSWMNATKISFHTLNHRKVEVYEASGFLTLLKV